MSIFGPRFLLGTGPLQGIDPNVPGGLVAWFDMQDNAAFTVLAGTVDSVTNKKSGVVWNQATANQRPLFSSSKLNGRQCMDFDGTNDIIKNSETAVWQALQDSAACTVFGVIQSDNADLSVSFFSAGNSGAAGNNSSRGWGTNLTGAGVWLANALNDAGVASNIESAGGDNTGSRVYEYFSDGVTGSIVIDGGAADPNNASQSIGTLTPNQCGIGGSARQTPNAFWNGAVGEILVYNRALNSAERSAVRQVLGQKWGIPVG